MATKVFLPRLGESIEEAVISKWCKQAGDAVKRGDVLVELETGKAMMELESPINGVLLKIFPVEGATIHLGDLVAVVGSKGEEWQNEVSNAPGEETINEKKSTIKKIPASSSKNNLGNARKFISPNARRLAKQYQVDLGIIMITPSRTRVTSKDIEAHIQGSGVHERLPPFHVLKLNTVQRVTAQRMVQSAQQIPQFSVSMQIDMGYAKRYLEMQRKKSALHITLTAMLLFVTAHTLKKFPRLNAKFQEPDILVFETVNTAVAVNTEDGLFAPVIHQVEKLSLAQISEKLNGLAEKAWNNKLSTADMEGATFTISNLGMMGIDQFIPIVDPSHAAIMGVGTIRKTAILTEEDSIRFTESMMITISADHRVVDGAYVSAFLNEIKASLEKNSKFKSGAE